MGTLSNLAAAIEGKRPPPIVDEDPALARRNAATADAIRAAGVPDMLNRFLPENERLNMKAPAPGSKEAQVRALRLSNASALSTPKATAPATKPATQAKPAVAIQETTMKTKKSKTAKKVRKLAKPKTRKTSKPAAAPSADGRSTKLQAIVALLQRPEGCVTKDILEATGWPTVSVPQQASAAGITLKKVKDGKVTRYWDLAFYPKKAA